MLVLEVEAHHEYKLRKKNSIISVFNRLNISYDSSLRGSSSLLLSFAEFCPCLRVHVLPIGSPFISPVLNPSSIDELSLKIRFSSNNTPSSAMTLLNSSTLTTSPNNSSVHMTTPKAPNQNNGTTFSSSFLSTPNRSQAKALSSLYPNISEPRDLSKPHRIALSPIKSPLHSTLQNPSINSSFKTFNSSMETPSSPSMSAALSQTKSAKKQIEHEYQTLLNRIKFLEEEERRSRAKLHQYDFITQKQEETKKLKQNTNNLFLKKKEQELKEIEEKYQIVSSVKVSG